MVVKIVKAGGRKNVGVPKGENGELIRGWLSRDVKRTNKPVPAALQEASHPFSTEPANLVKGSPELGGLVDVNLAGLLSVSLAELLAGPEALKTALKHASLAGEIGGAVQAEVAGEDDFVRVKQVVVGVVAEVDWLALPVHLEAVGPVGKRVEGRAVVGKRLEILVLAVGGNNAARWLRGSAWAPSSSGSNNDGRRRGQAVAGADGSVARMLWLGHSVGALGSGRLGGNGLGREDGVKALGSGLPVGNQESPLLEKPSATVAGEVLHDLRAEGQGELIVLAPWWRDSAEDDGGVGASANMVVDDTLVVLNLSRSKQRWLWRARRRRLISGIEDRVLNGLGWWRAGRAAGDVLGVRRDGRRHWQWVFVRGQAVVCSNDRGHGGEDL